MSSHVQHVMLLTVRLYRAASAESENVREVEVQFLQGRQESAFGSDSVSGCPQGQGAPVVAEAMWPGAGGRADGHGVHEALAEG
jgi:hypothetical protein